MRCDDSYVEKWAALRSEWSERIEADQNPVVFLGDSIACGWGKILKECSWNKGCESRNRKGYLIFVEHKKDVSLVGKTKSDDGRYAAINGLLVVTTPPEGRRIQKLWTMKPFDYDFVLKLEFGAAPYGDDSGLFLSKNNYRYATI